MPIYQKSSPSTRRNCSLAHNLLFFYRFIKGLVWVPRSTMSFILNAQQIPLGDHDIDVPHQARDTVQVQAILQLHLSEGMAAGVGLTRTEEETPTSSAACFNIRATASSVRACLFC